MKFFFYLLLSFPIILFAQMNRTAPEFIRIAVISDTGRAYFPCSGTEVFAETFDSEIPAAWDTFTVKTDSVFPTLGIPAGWHWYADSTNGAIRSVSWFYPADTADAWLFLPRVLIPSNACLSFKATSIDKDYPESYAVYLSQSDRSIDTFLHYPVLNVSAEGGRAENVWRRIDLSAYAGDSLYIAIHHNSYDKFILELDSFILTAAQNIDAGVFTVTSIIPAALDTFNFSGAVANYGLDTLQSVSVTWQQAQGPMFTAQYDSMNLAPGKLFWFTHPETWIPDTIGSFPFCFVTSNPNLLTDGFIANDSFCFMLDVNWFVGLEEGNIPLEITVYPNPFENELKIISDKLNLPLEINVFAQNGKLIYSDQNYLSGKTINSGLWNPGVYILKIQRKNSITVYKKVVKIN